MSDRYHVVQLANGTFSLRSEAYGETFHPVIGPAAEARALYVDQLQLRNHVREAKGEFVVWDVGLGAAANPLIFLESIQDLAGEVRIVSFDYTTEPLSVALQSLDELPYLRPWAETVRHLIAEKSVTLELLKGLRLRWELRLGDFPELLKKGLNAPAPSAIFYDAFSPATNPAMWTQDVFTRLYRNLDPAVGCSMPTYSRSTMLRVTLLLAGFYVGKGHATGKKEETSIAANQRGLVSEPLDHAWLIRAKRSRSAEPLDLPVYRQAPLTDETWERLRSHPQFNHLA